MKRFTRASDSSIPKQQNTKRVEELEQDKKALQKGVEELRHKFTTRPVTSKVGSEKVEDYLGKLNNLEEQVLELRKKLEGQSLLLKQKQKSDDAAKQMQDEICKIKSQKVELQRKIKQEAVQFRSWKALQEKEVLQLKKDGRKTEYERHKLFLSNERLKMVLQRKTEEASVATKWLKDLLKSRKASPRSGLANDPRILAIEDQLEVTELLDEIRSQCEVQIEERVRLAEEAAKFKEEADMLLQKNLWCLLQDKEADCTEKDSELKDLNEKVVKLSSLVEQLKIRNERFNNTEKSEGPQPSLALHSGGSNTYTLEDMIISKSQHSVLAMANSERTESVEKSSSQSGESSYGEGIVGLTVKTASTTCCSCSKKSSCKTNKCQCRASGGICGISCGCASTKCANREAVLVKELKISPQSETTGVVLASHAQVFEKPVELNDDCGTKPKPLSDIGNTEITENAAKPNQRRKRSSR